MSYVVNSLLGASRVVQKKPRTLHVKETLNKCNAPDAEFSVTQVLSGIDIVVEFAQALAEKRKPDVSL
jgi:hypothetical protein